LAEPEEEQEMRQAIGIDIHRSFAEVVVWEAGKLRPAGRVSMTRAGLEGFGRTLAERTRLSSRRPVTRWRWSEFYRPMSDA
jgi:transposase